MFPDMGERVDLGHDHSYSRVVDADLNWVGINQWHLDPATGDECVGGFVPFNTPEALAVTVSTSPHWEVRSLDPLHLEPSLLCRVCGDHGFIRDGRWEPA